MGQEENGTEDFDDVQLGDDIEPPSTVACCGLVDDKYLLTVRELVAQVVAQERDPRTTAVWMKGMDQWVTLEELMTHDSAARNCCRRCGRGGRALCKAAVGRASWPHTKVAISLALKRLRNGVVERVMASPMHGGALACLVLVTNYSNS
eukprot:COSAG02_NODE_33123_length_505_cov_0.645320_1_plen_148_part_01